MTVSRNFNPAPIVLFVYNRPEHTRRTLAALAANSLASESKLHILSDGPKDDHRDRLLVDEVREVIERAHWPGCIEVQKRQRNIGLAASIRSAIDSIVKTHDRVIVLEDDIETSTGFLAYMNEALGVYAEDRRVMNVSGWIPETSYQALLPSTFFLQTMSCWGWATWRRAWQLARWDAKDLLHEIERNPGGTHRFDLDGSYPFTEHLQRNISGELDTWAIYWAASCYVLNGVSLFPHRSLVVNTGFDGSGRHCHDDQGEMGQQVVAKSVPVKRRAVRESYLGRQYIKAFHRYGKDSGVKNRIARALHSAAGRVAAHVPSGAKASMKRLFHRLDREPRRDDSSE